MRAVTFHGEGDVRVEEAPDPVILAPTDVIVRVTRSGVCGSDLHVYNGEIPGVVPGSVLGHELAGVVEETGEAVGELAPGDRVVGAFHLACGRCRACRRGDFHQCGEGGILGYGVIFGDFPGAQAEGVRVPWGEVNLRRIPEGMSEEAALFAGDVLTTAFGAVRNADLRAGETCAVIGCGPVGLMAVRSAFLLGAGRVLALDLVEARARAAEGMGAVPIVSGRVNPVSRVQELTDGQGADAVIEAVGGPETLELAFDLVRGGGRISAVGVTAEETFDYPLMSALVKDVSFRIGIANIHRDIDAVLALLAAGRVDPLEVVSHRLPLEAAPEAYRLFAEREATKVVLEL